MKIEQVRIYTTKGTGTSPGYTISHIYVNGSMFATPLRTTTGGYIRG